MVLSLNVMVKKLREAFEDVDDFLLGLPSRSFHTPTSLCKWAQADPWLWRWRCVSKFLEPVVGGWGGGGERERKNLADCVLFCILRERWGNFNPDSARWRWESGGRDTIYHRGTRQILNLQGNTVN